MNKPAYIITMADKQNTNKNLDEKKPLLIQNSKEISKTNDSVQKVEKYQSKLSARDVVIGYMFILLMNISYSGSLILSQLSIGELSIFELLFFRYTLLTPVFLFGMFQKQESFKIDGWRDIALLVFMSATKQLYNTLYYFTPSLIAVNDVYSVFVTFTLVFSSVVDYFLGQFKKISVLAMVICITGLALCTQLWNTRPVSKTNGCVPCSIIDDELYNISSDVTIANSTDSSNATCSMPTFAMRHYINNMLTEFEATLMGYIFLVITAFFLTVGHNIFRHMSKKYASVPLLFWTSAIQWGFSLVICFSVYGTVWPLPSGIVCTLTSIALVISVSTVFFTNVTFRYFPVSHVYLGCLPIIALLYIAQRTFLSGFFPGRRNTMEVIGVVLVSVGAAVSPVYTIITEKCQT